MLDEPACSARVWARQPFEQMLHLLFKLRVTWIAVPNLHDKFHG